MNVFIYLSVFVPFLWINFGECRRAAVVFYIFLHIRNRIAAALAGSAVVSKCEISVYMQTFWSYIKYETTWNMPKIYFLYRLFSDESACKWNSQLITICICAQWQFTKARIREKIFYTMRQFEIRAGNFAIVRKIFFNPKKCLYTRWW